MKKFVLRSSASSIWDVISTYTFGHFTNANDEEDDPSAD